MDDDRIRATLPAGNIRVGVDVVAVPRFRRTLERTETFRLRVFTDAERAHCESRSDPVASYAARFAAKEAVRKAFGRSLPWRDVEVCTDPTGAPSLALAAGCTTADGVAAVSGNVSLSHDGDTAVAVVVIVLHGADQPDV